MKLHPFNTLLAGAIVLIVSSCNQAVPTDSINKTDSTNVIENVEHIENMDTLKTTQENPFDGVKISVNTYQTEVLVKLNNGKTDKGWGYDVLMDGKVYVHQPYIPAVSGNRSFRSKEDAEKTAALMMYKLKNNIVPPSLSVEELDSIGVTK